MSDQVGNPEDRFSQNEAHIRLVCQLVNFTHFSTAYFEEKNVCSKYFFKLSLHQTYSFNCNLKYTEANRSGDIHSTLMSWLEKQDALYSW